MKKLIIPERLRIGDTVGIVCPSAGIAPQAVHRLEQAKIMLEKMGFKVRYGKHIMSQNGLYISGSTKERVADLHNMFLNPSVRMILTGIGGNHSNHLLRFLDYSLIRNNPKIVIGYSDITVLHYAINTQAGLATYYGPCAATQFGEYPEILSYTKEWFERSCVEKNKKPISIITPSDKWTVEFMDWFKKIDQTRSRALIKNTGYKWLQGGNVHGEALVGCILSINRLAGTKYWINPKGKILFLDILISPGEINEALADAFLTDLKNIGVFDTITGLVIGRLYGYDEEAKKRLYVQIEQLTQKKYPIVIEFDIGHTDPMVTIRYGQQVELNSYSNQVCFLD
ncbi:MAG: S66 peptidase family protein [Patescibacteria group bacterium]